MSKIICTICARSGSQGIPNKNIKKLMGKHLLQHSIEVAINCGLFDEIVVSSDSKAYLDIAKSSGNVRLVHRPVDLAAGTVTKLGAIEHAVSETEKILNKEFDIIVDLDVTSPLRTVNDIKGAVNCYLEKDVLSVITGSPSRRSPYTNLVELTNSGSVQVVKKGDKTLSRRQESPVCYDMNASIYVWNRSVFKNEPAVFYEDTVLYEMPIERSWDIDEPIDFEIVEFFMARNQKQSVTSA